MSAAEAAEARMKANSMTVSELRADLASKGCDTRGALEKSDLVALYMQQRSRPAQPTPPPPPPPRQQQQQQQQYPQRSGNRPSGRGPSSDDNPFVALERWWRRLRKEVHPVNAFAFFLVALYVYKNVINPDLDTAAGGAGGKGGLNDVPGGLSSNAYLGGQVADLRTHGEFERMLDQHSLDTGLPVVIDFHSRGCGPCRQIAPYYSALARDMQGEAVFGKVNVNENTVTSRELGIRAMPTFLFFLNGKLRHRFSGADGAQLDSVARKLAAEAKAFMELGTFVNKEVTADALAAFYATHEPSKGRKEVEETLAKYDGKTAQLMRGLKTKYSVVPEVSARSVPLSPAAAAAAAAAEAAAAAASASKGKAGGGSDLASVSTDALEKELALRREEDSGEDLFTPVSALTGAGGSSNKKKQQQQQQPVESVVIVGGGPAGLSAAIYAARAGLKPVVLAPSFGGQLLGKGVDVENFPGVVGADATGRGIIEIMRKQAKSFAVRLVPEAVVAVVPHSSAAAPGQSGARRNEFELVLNDTERTAVRTRSVILATGAASRWLGVDGEYEFRGAGVSTCATCDGFLYRDKEVVVIGGGDTAMEDALVLARTSSKVTVIHRRGSFRASHALAQRVLEHERITVLWHATVVKFGGGAETGLESVRVQVNAAGKKKAAEQTIPCAAAFVAIGHDPVTDFVRGTGMKVDGGGYVLTGQDAAEGAVETATSIDGIFAAGDVSDHTYRQAITSAGSGAMAALDAEKYLSSS